jgi:hypothetical protein
VSEGFRYKDSSTFDPSDEKKDIQVIQYKYKLYLYSMDQDKLKEQSVMIHFMLLIVLIWELLICLFLELVLFKDKTLVKMKKA